MPAAGPTRTRAKQRRRSSGDLQRMIGPPSPSAGQQRASLERTYRGLIAQGRKQKFPGTLQIYRRKDIKNLSTAKLRKAIQDAYRQPFI